ncbi:hypothetical protein V6O07_13680, partial [Arthrospira platensis SPKY2]
RKALLIEQARRERRQNELGEGQSVKLADVQVMLNTTSAALAAELEALPGRMASAVVGCADSAHARRLLLIEVRGCRQRMADRLANLGAIGAGQDAGR